MIITQILPAMTSVNRFIRNIHNYRKAKSDGSCHISIGLAVTVLFIAFEAIDTYSWFEGWGMQ